ncbi:ankyrin-1-like isoform X2 [Stegostoma tigrinum]|uniref:ankyrin-1-like isoform X2 n=1 Tax=Stegostoma tigrinum TaxID=3053191 RepID=UPI0028708F88|nr:ankyrin-1-like isoform X2 [Stegostoma tigrinum]
MLTLFSEFLIGLVLLGFFAVSCHNVLRISANTVQFVLKCVHRQLDEELGERESGSDDEEIVATRVTRRRLIVKGEEAKNIPGESVTEEQFTDEDGNLVTKKVVRKVVRRVTPAEGKAETVEILHQDASGSENQADSSAKFGVFVRDSTSTTLGERGSALYSEWIHGRMGAQIVKRISSRANPSEQ